MTEDQFLFLVGLVAILTTIGIIVYFVLKLMGKDPEWMAFQLLFKFMAWNERLQEEVKTQREEIHRKKSDKGG
jgi:hypothetical protein